MRCNPLHRLFLVSLLFLASNAFPLRLYARRSASELMSGSSTNSIGCLQATDCAAAGYGIPANARYACDSQGRCTFGESFSGALPRRLFSMLIYNALRVQLELHTILGGLLAQRNSVDFLQLRSFSPFVSSFDTSTDCTSFFLDTPSDTSRL